MYAETSSETSSHKTHVAQRQFHPLPSKYAQKLVVGLKRFEEELGGRYLHGQQAYSWSLRAWLAGADMVAGIDTEDIVRVRCESVYDSGRFSGPSLHGTPTV